MIGLLYGLTAGTLVTSRSLHSPLTRLPESPAVVLALYGIFVGVTAILACIVAYALLGYTLVTPALLLIGLSVGVLFPLGGGLGNPYIGTLSVLLLATVLAVALGATEFLLRRVTGVYPPTPLL
ncbi:hypothetical protein [Halomicrobium sp. LC1Hm]|uniref:hypothetical protein n=1 Tax=Halomicrobium sp. LC1Hm TaxID=2610902 RepID=UPI0012982D75|nr:hypothetical protein [Halomicrobium sp. LC1Hm]QGA84214.1 hypothetical protein LC1Hm_3196 [Halomicrobium sp. LC1Hm]